MPDSSQLSLSTPLNRRAASTAAAAAAPQIKSGIERRENMLWFRVPPKIYFKAGCLETALGDLKGKERAIVITGGWCCERAAAVMGECCTVRGGSLGRSP